MVGNVIKGGILLDFCWSCTFLSSYPYELGGGSTVQCVLAQLCLTLISIHNYWKNHSAIV